MGDAHSPPPGAPAPEEHRGAGADRSTIEFVNADEKLRLDLFLCSQLPGRSRAFIQRLIDENWVSIPDLPVSREVKSATTVLAGMRVRVTFPPTRPSELLPDETPLEIIYEDSDVAVVNKPPNLVMHPSAHQLEGTLVNRLLHHLDDLSGIGGHERPGIVHRLDRDTSGVLVVAKHDVAHQALSRQFKEREIEKTYVAVLRGELTAREGSIHLPIGRSVTNRKRMMVRVDGHGKEALTEYEVLEEFDGYVFAEIRPRTGRTHQIRVHMAKIRLPVACDSVYGRERSIFASDLCRRPRARGEEPLIVRQALHARRLAFRHPTSGASLAFEAQLPEDMSRLLAALREHRALHAAR